MRPRHQAAAGFSLLEVMVTLVIISIGLLGIAAMQALAISNTHIANSESLMAMEAQSMASAMQANPAYWKAGLFPAAAFSVNGYNLSSATLNGQSATVCGSTGNTACTPVQMAGYDLKNWGANLQSQIPGAVGVISCTLGATTQTPPVCKITVNMTEKSNIAMNQGTTSAAPTVTKTYTLVSQL